LQARPVAPAKQLQQDEHPLVRTQGGEQSNLIVQRALQNFTRMGVAAVAGLCASRGYSVSG
jgi:hypothetical protein